ncbi:DUF1127 domain-containing protein [Jannaschia rubra]|uniref:DUF1127 domain-containing protein n=1 Tax=Jannaschia rubra TaxID=282197 RepID=UPI002491D880|nr:DUF1127 domain-containing protein [Jannaschia rubra]
MSVYITRQLLTSAPDQATRTRTLAVLRRRLHATLRQWRRRKVAAVLQKLDDATLDDIGIVRGQIGRFVQGLNPRNTAGDARSAARSSMHKVG